MKRIAFLAALALAKAQETIQTEQKTMSEHNHDDDVQTFDVHTKIVKEEKQITVQKIKSTLEEVNYLLSQNPVFSNFLSNSIDTPELIYFMGFTGVGKSTLINYLLGVEMQHEKKRKRYRIFPQTQQVEDNQNLPKIGNQYISETAIPQAYKEPGKNILYVDTPGFMNNKGLLEQISDSYANSRIFVAGKKIKIVLVMDYETLMAGRGQFLIKASKKLKDLFPKDFIQVMKSACVVATKVNLHQTPEKQISEIITEIIVDNKEHLDPQILSAFEQILKNNRVHAFPTPSFNMVTYTEELENKLYRQESKNGFTAYTLKNDAKLDLSADARIYVQKLGKLTKEYIEYSLDHIKKYIKEKFKQFINEEQVNQNKLTSTQIKEVLTNLSPLQAMISNQEKLTDDGIRKFLNIIGITDTLAQNDLLKNIDYLEYCNSLHQYIDVSNFFLDISNLLQDIMTKIKLNLQKIESKEEVDRIMNKHSQDIMKVKSEMTQAYTNQISKMQAEYANQMKNLENSLNANRQAQMKVLTENYNSRITQLKDQMNRNSEVRMKDMQQAYDQRIQDLTNQMATANERELKILRDELERLRNQPPKEIHHHHGGGGGGGGCQLI